MAKSKKQKNEVLDAYKDQIEKSTAIYFFDTAKISGSQISELRNELAKDEATIHQLKNTIFRIAAGETKLKDLGVEQFEGQTGAIFCTQEITNATKILAKFIKDTELAQIKSGILDGRLLSAEKISQLAKLPNRQELLALVVNRVNAPLSGFVNVSISPLRGFINILNELKSKNS